MMDTSLAGELRRDTSRQQFLHGLLVIVAACLAFGVTLGAQFVYDDFAQVVELPLIRELKNLPHLFTSDIWSSIGRESPYYRPIFFVSLALDYFFWGEQPTGYHLTSVLLHAMASFLVYRLAYRFTGAPLTAVAAGLLFAVHPGHVEAVSWVSARNELLCAVFTLAALVIYLEYRKQARVVLLLTSLVFFFAGLLSKEMAITLPILIFLYEYSQDTGKFRRAVCNAAWFLIPTVVYLFLRMATLKVYAWGVKPLSARVLTAPSIVVEYVRVFFIPFKQTLFYSLPIQTTIVSREVLAPLGILLGLLVGMVFVWRRDRLLWFCVSWFFVVLLPVSGLPALLNPTLVAERYFYLPSVGFCLGSALLFSRWLPMAGPRRSAVLCCGVTVVIILLLVSVQHSRAWQNQQTFMAHVVADAPDTEFGHFFRGVMLKEAGRSIEAVGEFQQALALNPRLPEAYYNLATIALEFQNRQQAIDYFLNVLDYDQTSVKTHNNLGVLYAVQGDFAKAATHFEAALRYDPADRYSRENLQKIRSIRQ